MNTLNQATSADNTKAAAPVWGQRIMVRGNALALLERATNLRASDPDNIMILRGVGAYFPKMEAVDWAAACVPILTAESSLLGLSDITPILRALLGTSMLTTTDAPRAEVEAFLRDGALDS